MNVDDVMLCRIYGELARAHYGVQWDMCEERLREGWLRVRGRSRMEWSEAEPLARSGIDVIFAAAAREDAGETLAPS